MKTDGRQEKNRDLPGAGKQIEELARENDKLKEQLALYEHLLNSTRDVVMVKDTQSRIVYANRALCDLYGMPAQQLHGLIDASFNEPEFTSQYLADDAYVLQTGNTLMIPEEPVTRHDGVIRIFETIKSPIAGHDGKPALLVAVARDITERTLIEEDRKRAEQALDDTERLFRQMAESMRDVFWICTPGLDKFLYVSPAYEVTWGRPCTELLQDASSWWQLILPADRPDLTRKVEALLAAGDGKLSEEFRILRGEEVRWVWVRTFPILDAAGNLVKICGITHDITERKEVEKRVSEFNSMVSHELRTPLTSIRAALGLIEGGQTEPVGDSTRDLIHIARVECDRMIRLINDLLDIKKIEAEKLDLNIEQLSPVDLVERALSAHRSIALASGVNLKADVNAKQNFPGDRDRILQVLMNLLSNAIKYSPAGADILLSVSGDEPDYIRFAVHDAGPGIPEGERAKLFTAFQQIDSSDSRAKGGTGLGLAISKAIVDRHGGVIGVDTDALEGTTFWFKLPLITPAG